MAVAIVVYERFLFVISLYASQEAVIIHINLSDLKQKIGEQNEGNNHKSKIFTLSVKQYLPEGH
jgi:hypothetical protein